MSYYPEYDFKKGQEPKQTELLIDIKTKTIRTDVDLDDGGMLMWNLAAVPMFDKKTWYSFLFQGNEPTLNMTLRTKWDEAEITWNGTQPYV